MNLDELKSKLEKKLEKQIITSRVLLDRFRVIEESSRQTSAYTDPNFIPFYYYLGEFLAPKNLIEIGFRIALFSGCFLKSCKTIENFLAFQEKHDEYYSPKLGKSNIKDVYKKDFFIHIGKIQDDEFLGKLSTRKWELVLVNEEISFDKHLEYLDVIWQHLADDGIIVHDYIKRHKPAQEAFLGFCKSKNKKFVEINTRYGVGIVKK